LEVVMLKGSQQQLLREITRRILTVSTPEQVLLFGSSVRGDAGPDSDLDLLVIEDVDRPRQRSVEIRRTLRGLLIPIDVIVATPQQIERYGQSPALMYQSALRDGQVLYERPPRT
jgi:uncharacterized protein